MGAGCAGCGNFAADRGSASGASLPVFSNVFWKCPVPTAGSPGEAALGAQLAACPGTERSLGVLVGTWGRGDRILDPAMARGVIPPAPWLFLLCRRRFKMWQPCVCLFVLNYYLVSESCHLQLEFVSSRLRFPVSSTLRLLILCLTCLCCGVRTYLAFSIILNFEQGDYFQRCLLWQ